MINERKVERWAEHELQRNMEKVILPDACGG